MRSRLTEFAVVKSVLNSVAAGTSNQNSSVVDLAGYDGVTFIADLGTLTATQVTGLKIQTGTLADGSDMADVTGGATAAMADGDSNKLLVAEIYRPLKRYARAVVTRGTANAVIDGVIALLHKAKAEPVTADSSVSASVSVASL